MSDIDHRTIIAALSVEDRRDLTARLDRPGIVRLAVHGGLVILLGALIAARIPLWPLLVLPQGILIVFCFTPLHETIHETAFRTAWLNRAVAAMAGFLILLPPAWFRYFHFAHHRHTHDPENDPELMAPKPETVSQYLRYLSGGPYWIAMGRVVATNAAGRNRDGFVPEKSRGKVVAEARLFLIGYAVLLAASLAIQSALLLWVWIVPVLVGQPFLRAYLLAEHALCPHVANMLENTRTTFTNRLVRFVAWNMPYHSEHHSYPAVPFHRLPRFHEIVAEHLGTTERGYVRFHRKLVGSFDGRAG
ncbi:fatty acid desaturase family protein [Mesorhizobium sp. LMG 17147]|uniref:fatty acid desaturase family protein n=1 Tax=Mesorhizobium sp. LMG 17147 TaxID=2963091 RepID=UPI0020C9DE53|nr:fatty acid desaturase family protein [Mesorhizobium sp. LMG 17147]